MASCALPSCEVMLDDCFVPDDAVLGGPGSGFRVAMNVFERARPIIGARAVGLARGAMEAAVDYVKHREAFRPFALSIPEDACADYFNCSPNGRFMATMATANEKGHKLLQVLPEGFLLKDNLVRLHVVTVEANPLFYRLLNRSGEKGPAPMFVNTSFNLFGEPLVVTPRDAVRSYFCSGADALLIGNFLLTKT